MITVKELKEQLAELPDDMPIILQTDDEGNGYRYIRGIDPGDENNKNYFSESEEECYRTEDLKYLEIDESDYEIDYRIVAVIF